METTILLVDDEVNILNALKRVFADEGYHILTATRALEALNLLDKNSVQIIISDQRLPEMTGTEFLAKVRKLYPHTIRMILSGYSDFNVIKDAINEGHIYKFINKPWNDDELRALVKESIKAFSQKNITTEMIKKEAQAEVKRIQSNFLANMSHEIRTPLAGITGFSEVLFNGLLDPNSPEHKECLKDILTSSQTLSNLVTNILDLAQAESGELKFIPEKIDLNQVITEVKKILNDELIAKKIQLEVKVDPILKHIVNDYECLKKIILHYLSNAVKFSNEGGKVEIIARPEKNNSFSILIKDYGIGIQAENISNLFTAFKQLDMTAGKKYQGAGISLALVRRIVEAQGGNVGVESELGKGSTFFAILPNLSLKKNKQ